MHRIAVIDDYQAIAELSAPWRDIADCDVTFFHDHIADPAEVAARLRDFDIVIAMRERTPFTRGLFELLPNLKLLVTTGMRNAAIDTDVAAERGVVVCGTRGLGNPTAELTWALIGALARDLHRQDRDLRAGRWQTRIGVGLSGKTLGIIGLGKQGSQVARYAAAFEMNILAWSENLTSERAKAAGATLVSFDDLMRRSDFVSVHLLLSERTFGLIDKRALSLMKRDAFLINTSRGPIVVEEALVECLAAGGIRGAALDVFDREPLPADHPLIRADNTLLTPHVGYATEESYRIYYGDAVEDVTAFLAGDPVRVLTAS